MDSTVMSTKPVRLWQLISSMLPVGAYSYSQALEYVVHAGQIRDQPSAQEWIGDLLSHGLANADLPVLLRVHRAWTDRDLATVAYWSRELEGMRETAELRFEDLSMGGALAQLMSNLGLGVFERRLPFACAFAIASAQWCVPPEDACAGYAWAWCEAQVAAAIKLVPLGHTAGQRILLNLGAQIEAAVNQAMARHDTEIGMSLPGFAIASSLHETQYTRLFRS
jgi:urease accessory protein